MSRLFYLIAGEPSGDRLGADLMRGLKALEPDARFAGIGGPQMAAEGLESLFPMSDLSVMGLAEVLPKLRHLFKRRDETVADVLAQEPDVLITIDSPDFCLRVAAKVREAAPAIPTIHYVCPSVWVWRAKRAAKMAKHIDHVLALLPFEPPYMEAEGMTCDFVGHPVVNDPVPSEAEQVALRAELGLGPERVLCLLPGSRKGEVTRLLPVFRDTVEQLAADIPDLQFVLPMAGHVAPLIRAEVETWPVKVTLLDPSTHGAEDAEARKRALLALSDVALAASGTVALELAHAGTPMVIAYRMSALSGAIVLRMIKVPSVNLVNLLNDQIVIPEFLQAACDPAKITPAVAALFEDDAALAAQESALKNAMTQLGQGGEAPGLRAARSVLSKLG